MSSSQVGKLTPMLSFGRFADKELSRDRRLSERELDNLFRKYRSRYAIECLDHFFDKNLHLDWFADKFDPFQFAKDEESRCKSSTSKSIAFFGSFDTNPAESVNECRLDDDLDIEAVANIDNPSRVELSTGRHCEGHICRTVCIKYIKASCPRSDLKAHITLALQKINIIPERVLISSPQVYREEPSSERGLVKTYHERTVWVVLPRTFPEGVTMEDAFKALIDLRFEFSTHVDENTGEPTIDEVKLTLPTKPVHQPAAPIFLKPILKSAARLSFDLRMALILADLLDQYRNIPVSYRLASLLGTDETSKISQYLVKPTDSIDVAVSYLRIVHSVNYFSGKSCVDEAHLLMSASEISLWDKEEPDNTIEYPKDELAAMTDEEYLKWLTEHGMDHPQVDNWILHEISSLKTKLAFKADKTTFEPPGDISTSTSQWIKDMKDAAEIEIIYKDTEEDWMRRHTLLKQEGKAQCSFAWCNGYKPKTFSSVDFLHKHIVSKHSGTMRGFMVDTVLKSYMKMRFDSYSLLDLPIPDIEIESKNGKIERSPVSDFLSGSSLNGHLANESARKEKASGAAKRGRAEEGDAPRPRGNPFDVDAPKVSLTTYFLFHIFYFTRPFILYPQLVKAPTSDIVRILLHLWDIEGFACGSVLLLLHYPSH